MTEANSNIGPAHQNLQENDNEIASLIESVKKLSILINDRDTEVVCDSGSECPIISYEIAKKLGLEINKSLPDITDKVVSDIVKQVSGKKIWISLHRLLEIVKPEIQQNIINSITNSDISRRNHTPCKAKRKKKFLNDTASDSSSSSSSEYGSISE